VSTRRLLKAAEAVREVVSMAILTQVRDPRVQGVTVTRVEMDPDMRAATVHVSVMGSPAKEELALRGLASSAGFLQSQIAERIETRYTPRLKFKLDSGVKRSIEIARVLSEVLPGAAVDASLEAADGAAEEVAADVSASATPSGPVRHGATVDGQDQEKPEESA
jgi:ribosome-binding factor A